MSDSAVLARLGNRQSDERGEIESRLNTEAWDDLGSFGWLRGIRDRATMLELRKKSGNILAVSYGWLEKAEFDPSDGITLHITGQTIRIKGRDLNTDVRPTVRLFEGITRHRVPWIREASGVDVISAQQCTCVIESISW
jgi:hypothetical protein